MEVHRVLSLLVIVSLVVALMYTLYSYYKLRTTDRQKLSYADAQTIRSFALITTVFVAVGAGCALYNIFAPPVVE